MAHREVVVGDNLILNDAEGNNMLPTFSEWGTVFQLLYKDDEESKKEAKKQLNWFRELALSYNGVVIEDKFDGTNHMTEMKCTGVYEWRIWCKVDLPDIDESSLTFYLGEGKVRNRVMEERFHFNKNARSSGDETFGYTLKTCFKRAIQHRQKIVEMSAQVRFFNLDQQVGVITQSGVATAQANNTPKMHSKDMETKLLEKYDYIANKKENRNTRPAAVDDWLRKLGLTSTTEPFKFHSDENKWQCKITIKLPDVVTTARELLSSSQELLEKLFQKLHDDFTSMCSINKINWEGLDITLFNK